MKQKFVGVKRIELLSTLRSPGNRLCPNDNDPGTIVPEYVDQAIAAVAAESGGLVTVGPKIELQDCSWWAGGTDLTVKLGEYPTMIQYGYAESPGRFDHWGAGHVHTFPNEGSANGTVVFAPGDIIVLPYCRYVQDEVRLDIRDGFIRKIEGGLDAKLMSDWLEGNKARADDLDGHAVSHLGWGLNPQGRWDAIALNGADPKRHHAGARCFAGNFLFSTGPNSQGGGKRTTKGHYDVPMRDCTVALDNDVIIERGKLTDAKMQVAFLPR